MPTTPDADTVAADDQLVEDLRHGHQPPTDDQIMQLLGAWRDDTRDGTDG